MNDSPTLAIKQEGKEEEEISLGKVTELMWYGHETLVNFVQRRINEYAQKKREQEQQEQEREKKDPLYAFREKMKRIGYPSHYRIVLALNSHPQKSYEIGDTLLEVRCYSLISPDPYVPIGPLHVLSSLPDTTLRKKILHSLDEAKKEMVKDA